MTHTLYRCFGVTGELLYIGITGDTNNRFAVHACTTPWWPDVAVIGSDDTFGSRDELEAAERAAIHAEIPRYNVEHNDDWHTKYKLNASPPRPLPFDPTGLSLGEIFDKFISAADSLPTYEPKSMAS